MPVRRVKRNKPSGRQFSIFGGAMYGMRKMRPMPLPRGLMLQGAGRRHHMGRGFLDTLKNIGSKALGIARSVPIASTALGLMGQPGAAGIARTLGLGMRRRRHRIGGTRRVGGAARKRVGVVRRRRVGRNLISSLLGMGRKRRVTRHRRVGRGLLSSLLGMAGMGRKRRVRHRVGGTRRVGGAARRVGVARRRYVR